MIVETILDRPSLNDVVRMSREWYVKKFIDNGYNGEGIDMDEFFRDYGWTHLEVREFVKDWPDEKIKYL